MDAHSYGRVLFHFTHSISNALHRSLILLRNNINGTITTVNSLEHRASNINNMFLLLSVFMITTIGVACYIIACNATSCIPRNRALSPNICCNWPWISICRIACYRRFSSNVVSCAVSIVIRAGFWTCFSSRNIDSNIQNTCYSRLIRRNKCRFIFVLFIDSLINHP
jgi:hypothetical protein